MSNALQNQILPLEDIIVPTEVSIWPLAFGWWLLLAIVIAVVIAVFIFYKKYRKKWDYRKEALNLLNQYQVESWGQTTASKYLECLKRTAMSAYPTQNIQALHGKAWVDFLNRQTPTPLFDDKLARFICESQYQKTITIDQQDLVNATTSWVKKHATQMQASPTVINKEVQ